MVKNNIYTSLFKIAPLTIWLFCCGMSTQTFAQLHLNVGYNATYLDNQLTNDILQRYNENNPWLSQTFESYNIMDGIVAGSRYKIDNVAFLLQWTNKKKHLKAEGTDPITEEEAFRDLDFRYNSYSAGLQFFIEAFSFGGMVDYSQLSIKTEHTEMTNSTKVISKADWSTHLFVNLRIYNSRTMAISIQPYVHLPWNDFNLLDLEKELNPSVGNNADPADYNTSLKNYGISLIFYNGKQ